MAELQYGYYAVNPAYERLLEEYLSLRLTNEAAYEHARHGFVRRLGTLKRCIENVYSTYLPERFDKPSRKAGRYEASKSASGPGAWRFTTPFHASFGNTW